MGAAAAKAAVLGRPIPAAARAELELMNLRLENFAILSLSLFFFAVRKARIFQ